MSTTLSITPSLMIASAGKFDSRRRYIKRLGSGLPVPFVVGGKTINIAWTNDLNFGSSRWSVNGCVVVHIYAEAPVNNFNAVVEQASV